jgi:hypothetical protein
VKAFMVSQDGGVFEKDLGQNTQTIAERTQAFDPDSSWERPQPAPMTKD